MINESKAKVTFEKYADISDYYFYGKDILRHKRDVYKAGRELGLPRLTLLKHDIDKFLPGSFVPYTKWFYGSSGIKGAKDPQVKKEWRAAVQRHYERNPHHANKLGKSKTINVELESVADWFSASARAAGYKKNFPSFREWLLPRLDNFNISLESKKIVREILV